MRQRDDPYKKKRKEFESLGRMMPKVLGELGLDGTPALLLVCRAWEAAVGAEVARHCQPVRLRDGVLEVRTEAGPRAQEISLRRPILLAGLRRELGADAPTDLRIRVG